MTSSDIRSSFLDFFREKGHTIVPSSPLLPDAPNLLFTNAGMNQFVPIFLGQAPAPRPPRAADTQKCIRAGGKHNDLEDVGFDTYHHTFFEMLGNWSFGDYFKKEAIAWAWELVVDRWNFPASRIYATVYQPGPGDPASFDREAYDHWAAVFTAAGLDPAIHIVNGNKKDNFWMMGDTGPCGPCSELHIDLTPGPSDPDLAGQKEGRKLVNSGDARCIEIWNLVFIQFNANPDGTFGELPAKHVDTGMGFERVVSMIQGTKGFTDFENAKISNYETDVFRPLFDELEKLTGKKYGSTLPASAQNETEQEKIDVAFRVIADHIRTLSFSIADGIQPSNEGRGYVLRRILRRAVRYGRNLGLREPFLGKLVAVLGATMGHIFPEVVAKADLIRKTLTNEEESFFRTLERGIELFESVILSLSKDQFGKVAGAGPAPDRRAARDDLGHPELVEGSVQSFSRAVTEAELILRQAQDDGTVQRKIFPGSEAFKLYDTYGFPLDLTELMARERGMTVDVVEFNRLMEEQKARGKAAQKKEVIEVFTEDGTPAGVPNTKFIGYDEVNTLTGVVLIEKNFVATRETPFYAEMGGQVGDTGKLKLVLGDHTFPEKVYTVENTIRSGAGGTILHKIAEPVNFRSDASVILEIDQPRRANIEAHHSGTHLLNWTLRKVLGNTVSQKGSYVGPDRLRFDFSHGAALTREELAEVERLVNEKIDEDVPVKWEERAYAEVKGDPSILQFFGDKYGDMVRVVSIGDFSKELCGGTHVRQSGKVGYFKILHEAAIAAGIRRIEAASGEALRAHLEEVLRKQEEQLAQEGAAAQRAAATGAAATAESLPELWQRYKDREKLLHDIAAQRIQHEKDEAKRQEAAFQKRAAADAPALIASARTIGDVPFLAHQVTDSAAAYLPVLADALKTRWQGVAVLATVDQGKVALLAAVAPAHAKKIQAGKIIQAIAPLVGGKGGGRPELAQGGGTNPEGVTVALAKAEELVRG
ncbi:MAG: alanine--tRNA ligase [Methylacidiphilales bacterium]|nr:alanine--tRNA ligase [Candidatus Methylacidiphilales bacterium]